MTAMAHGGGTGPFTCAPACPCVTVSPCPDLWCALPRSALLVGLLALLAGVFLAGVMRHRDELGLWVQQSIPCGIPLVRWTPIMVCRVMALVVMLRHWNRWSRYSVRAAMVSIHLSPAACASLG